MRCHPLTCRLLKMRLIDGCEPYLGSQKSNKLNNMRGFHSAPFLPEVFARNPAVILPTECALGR